MHADNKEPKNTDKETSFIDHAVKEMKDTFDSVVSGLYKAKKIGETLRQKNNIPTQEKIGEIASGLAKSAYSAGEKTINLVSAGFKKLEGELEKKINKFEEGRIVPCFDKSLQLASKYIQDCVSAECTETYKNANYSIKKEKEKISVTSEFIEPRFLDNYSEYFLNIQIPLSDSKISEEILRDIDIIKKDITSRLRKMIESESSIIDSTHKIITQKIPIKEKKFGIFNSKKEADKTYFVYVKKDSKRLEIRYSDKENPESSLYINLNSEMKGDC